MQQKTRMQFEEKNLCENILKAMCTANESTQEKRNMAKWNSPLCQSESVNWRFNGKYFSFF